MTIRQSKMLIGLAAVAIALLSLAVITWGFTSTVSVTPSESRLKAINALPHSTGNSTDGVRAVPTATPARRTLAELRRICSANLRRPLFDPPEPPAPPADDKPQPPRLPMTATLSGTAIEDGHSVAIFRTRDSRFKVCPVGAGFEEPGGTLVVTRIDGPSVTVTWNGARHELTVPKPEFPQ